MYNRYIPQPDGSYRRNRIPDSPVPPRQHQPPREPPKEQPCPEPEPPAPPPKPEPRPRKSATKSSHSQDNFLHQLLPKDFDTGDLIVVLLLLLMAGDSEKDRNHAILTMALYFMM